MKRLILNPAWFRFLDHLPAPRMPRIRKRGRHNADALTPPKVPAPGWTGPKHASSERISCGGLSRGTLPRREPGDTRMHLIDRGPDRAPWLTGELAVHAGETRPPVNTDAETLRLYRGDYGTMPVERVSA